MPRVEDVTEDVVRDSSSGPGEHTALVARTKGAKAISAGMQKVLDKLAHSSDNTVGHLSRVVAYAMPWKFVTKTEHANFVRLLKGGHVRVCRVEGPAPSGSRASREALGQQRHYLMRVGSCPIEVPDGTLYGAKRKQRR